MILISVPVTPELRQGGPSAAVIAGIVAVAVFVLIVTVILLLRYFMSHKGKAMICLLSEKLICRLQNF